ncbi:MAG: hypothetical protein IJ197_07930 [Bacteroidaceae bacterium]|nr:hypothetical protein [Bacteroidaceae bacterium]
MQLYFNSISNLFYTKSYNSQYGECIFTPHEIIERHKDTIEVADGKFKIDIFTNFYGKEFRYIRVKIYIDKVQLLPVSRMFYNNNRLYHEQNYKILTFRDYFNKINGPYTFAFDFHSINWEDTLVKICDICNNYKSWQVNEVQLLIKKMSKMNLTHFYDLSKAIDYLRPYDDVIPDIGTIYKPFFNNYAIDAMKELQDWVAENKQMSAINKKEKAHEGDIIWQYIKDSILNINE